MLVDIGDAGSQVRSNKEAKLPRYREPNAHSGAVTVDLGSSPAALGLAGGLVVFIFTVIALSAAVNTLRVSSFSGTAIVAAFTGVVSLTVVLLYHRVPRPAARAAATYIVLVGWMLGSLVIDGTSRQGLQFIMVQIAFVGALLLASTARLAVGSRLDLVVARCFRLTSSVAIGSEILRAADARLSLDGRVIAIVSVLCLCWFLAEYRAGKSASLWWSLAVVLGIAISLSRVALFAGVALVVGTMFLATDKRRIRNVILGLLVVASATWAVTSWPPLRDRFFKGDVSLSVAGINVNGEGRAQVWSVLWSGVQDEPIIGHGPGAASARSLLVSPDFDHPHNDYLLILYDFGIIGLGLLAWFLIRSARLLRRAMKESRNSIPTIAALNAGIAVLIIMVTDNPLDYPFVMIPLGALIGLGLGSKKIAEVTKSTHRSG